MTDVYYSLTREDHDINSLIRSIKRMGVINDYQRSVKEECLETLYGMRYSLICESDMQSALELHAEKVTL